MRLNVWSLAVADDPIGGYRKKVPKCGAFSMADELRYDFILWRDYAKANPSITGGVNQLKHEIRTYRDEYVDAGVIIRLHQTGTGERQEVVLYFSGPNLCDRSGCGRRWRAFFLMRNGPEISPMHSC